MLAGVLDACRAGGASVETVELASPGGVDAAVQALGSLGPSGAVVLGTPIYRATYAAPVKALLDAIPREQETGESSLRARATGIVATGASLHHFLGLHELRSVLAVFFAAIVVPPGLYVPRDGFDGDDLRSPYDAAAETLGGSLVELAAAVSRSSHLTRVVPQA